MLTRVIERTLDPTAWLIVTGWTPLASVVSVEGDDAKRLELIAAERGQRPGEVVSQLLRSA